MGNERRAAAIEELLAETGWLRALAVRLAGDSDRADDAVQDTWIAALRHPPDLGESPRPWLARVLRNALRMRARTDGRRAARERRAAEVAGEGAPTPDRLVARAEAQRELAGLVLRLEEPYRSTVLLHFCEGMTLAAIAREQGVAAGTARWRLKRALDQLRDWLGDAGDSAGPGWALAPLLSLPKGAVVAEKSSKALAIALLLLLAGLIGGGFWWRASRNDATATSDTPAHRLGLAPPIDRAASMSAEPEGPAWLTQPGVTPRRVAGVVTFEGSPVSGATVVLASLATESGVAAPPRITTDASGRFDFGLRPAVEWSLRASAPGKTGAQLDVDLRDPVRSPPADQLAIELGPCEAAMVGTVRDASGGPIAGARLARLGGASSIPGGVAVETDADGAYELCVEKLWPSRAFVEITASGYGAVVYTGLIYGRVRVDLALVPEATITGRVVRDDSGEPVAGAHVFLPRGPWGTETTAWRGTFTDDSGRFRLDQVAPGRHVVRARAEGMIGSRGGTPVVVSAGDTTGPIEIRLAAAAVVRGVVLRDGEPIAGARVAARAVDGTGGSRIAVSQSDGSFALEEVPRGAVRFSAWPYEVREPEVFEVTAAAHDGVVLEVEALGAIRGEVTHRGRPVPGARVHLHGPNEGQLEPITTGDDGRFEARGLRPGPWVLFAESERRGRFGKAPAAVDVEAGETGEVRVELTYGAAIAGQVVDQDGAPVAGVSVQFAHTEIDDAGAAITGADGRFRAATMTGGGRYRASVRPYVGATVELRPAGGRPFPLVDLDGPDAEVTGVVLVIDRDRLTIGGRVVDTAGAPIADVRVSAAPITGGATPLFFRWIQHASATTDVDGRFSIGDLARGDYAVRARAAAGLEVIAANVRAGRSDLVLTLPAAGRIEGTLVGFSARPRVTAQRAEAGGRSAATAEVGQGTFALDELSPGAYVVTARDGDSAAAAPVEVKPGATARVTLTAGGSRTITGRVRTLRDGAPIEGMTCRAHPRAGEIASPESGGSGGRTGAGGRFTITGAPGGEVAVVCVGLWRLYSDGVALLGPAAGEPAELDVLVVARPTDVTAKMGGLGAVLDLGRLVARLISVRPGGPAASAGLRAGDRITAVDGRDVSALSPRGVRTLLTSHPPGTEVSLVIDRGGQRVTARITLGEPEIF